jgi:hypothetical protein
MTNDYHLDPQIFQNMTDCQKRLIFDAFLKEYEKYRDEVTERISAQNSINQTGLVIVTSAAGGLATLYSLAFKQDVSTFLGLAIAVSAVCSLLLCLLLAFSVYQLRIIFRFARYFKCMAARVIDPLVGTPDLVFCFERDITTKPWILAIDQHELKPLQALFGYGLFGLSWLALLVLSVARYFCVGQKADLSDTLFSGGGLIVCVLLLAFIKYLSGLHSKLIKLTETFVVEEARTEVCHDQHVVVEPKQDTKADCQR